ncbi:NfeD family protein [Mammaliicoccus sp. Dog046]|uniref:NfeD family protein n=1 Tax=Mammaliicoccus sp. Dog046 TaxID=3034233 RepID=UPI003A5BDF65
MNLGIISNESLSSIGDFISLPIVTLVLTCIIFLGALYQIYSKHINFAGILSIICTLIFFIGYVIIDEISLISVLLFGVGVLLVIIELFVIGAILGILGFIAIIASFILVGENILTMGMIIAIALILTTIEWVILVKGFNRKIPFFDKVILRDSTNKESGYTSHDDRSHLIGKLCVTYTALRPSGIIIVDDERIDAVSDGTFIQKDQQVKIVQVEGTRVVVREI